jgi:hypothetical protein
LRPKLISVQTLFLNQAESAIITQVGYVRETRRRALEFRRSPPDLQKPVSHLFQILAFRVHRRYRDRYLRAAGCRIEDELLRVSEVRAIKKARSGMAIA